MNHKPVVRDDSHAFWRRVRLVPFTKTFPVDKTLADALMSEASRILGWIVKGSLAWQERGLDPPDVVTKATDEYKSDSDPVPWFLEAACRIGEKESARAGLLFKHYKCWSEREGLSDRERLNATAFGRKISERFKYITDKHGKTYYGVGFTAAS